MPETEPVLINGFAEKDRQRIISLLREYEAGIGVPLDFQDFDAELAGLPGDYASPGGTMILARQADGGELLGCVALRPVRGSPELCEIKRLFVRPAGRGNGLGRRLAVAAMAEARKLGYARVCLDTMPSMTAAQELYRALGFQQVGVSATEPVVLLFECDLRSRL